MHAAGASGGAVAAALSVPASTVYCWGSTLGIRFGTYSARADSRTYSKHSERPLRRVPPPNVVSGISLARLMAGR
jgi:hypothetical protein